MITLRGLTKRYGANTVVDDLTVEITGGKVTGFLGPNGSGKSTTMRVILGLDKPSSGTALVGGRRYVDFRHPLREVGALLDAKALHPGRSARDHLIAMARSNGIDVRRVDAVLDEVGLTSVADRRAGEFSLGMGQRLGIAGALLGDPGVLMFDEPVNGLDPDGVRWIRDLMHALSGQGRTVFVSSHLMSEMQITADHLLIIGMGRLIADAPIGELIAASSRTAVQVRSPDRKGLERLHRELVEASLDVQQASANELLVAGEAVEQIGDLAHRLSVPLHGLRRVDASLEQAYLELTGHSVEYGDRARTGSRTGHDDPHDLHGVKE